jgi:hypothetical protein
MESLSQCLDKPATTTSTVIMATAAATAVASLASLGLRKLWPKDQKIIPGPLTTAIPNMSKEDLKGIAYQPDHFPGARDVVTPYGNIRVYEFGPEDGRKVLFIHGISTSCMTLSDIAMPLSLKGCRVMLFVSRDPAQGVVVRKTNTHAF